jgi:putative salt-induced outer membrane protein YdiY
MAEPWKEPEGEGWDWVMIDTHEWLKGTIKEMRSGDIVFDSDKFGDLTFSFGDVLVLHSSHENVFVTDEGETFVGTAEMRDGHLLVTSQGTVHAMDQAQVLSVVSSSTSEIENWDFAASFGSTLRRGNTDSFDYSAYARLRRTDAFNRASLQYDGAFGMLNGVDNAHKHLGQAAWEIFLSPLFYAKPFLGSIQYDRFANLDTRWVVGAGAGIHLIDDYGVTLDFDLTGGFTQTNYISVQAGSPTRRDDALIRPHLNFTWDITDDIDWEIDWTTSIIATDPAYTFHRGTTRFNTELTDLLTLTYSAIYDRQETTVARADGTLPVRDDIAMTVSVGVTLE